MSKFVVVEKQFEYKGHDCICIFGCRGYRCGYVSVCIEDKNNMKDVAIINFQLVGISRVKKEDRK